MTILLVDTDAVRMRQTARMVQNLLPTVDGLSTTDPLLAAKYAFEHPVDLLIAGLNMKRMDGLQLSTFLQEKSPHAAVCLFATRRELACSAEAGRSFHPLPLPIQEAALQDILNQL